MFILKILNYKNFINNLEKKILMLKKNNLLNLKIKKNLINYIINVKLTKKNILLYVTDIKRNLKIFKTTNSLGLKKIKQQNVLLKLLKIFLLKSNFLKNNFIALHLINLNKYFINLLIKILENILFIKIIKIYNFLTPHNGCRPKKLKRKKKQKLKFN